MHIQKDTAETFYINDPESTYGTFCFNTSGDLFLNSDYGYYCYSWRAFGTDFKKFLSGLNPEYVFDKFDTNAHHLMKKAFPNIAKNQLLALLNYLYKQ